MKNSNFSNNQTKKNMMSSRMRHVCEKMSPMKAILFFAVPNFIIVGFQMLYQISDTSIGIKFGTGHQLFMDPKLNITPHTIRLAAQYSAPLWSIAAVLYTIVAISFRIYLNHFIAQNEEEKMKRFVATSLIQMIVLAIIFQILAFFLVPWIVNLQMAPNAPPQLATLAVVFSDVLIVSVVFNLIGYSLNSLHRSYGYPKLPAIAQVSANILNVILDLIFTIVFKWGLIGCAVATVISAVVFCLMDFLLLFRIKGFSFLSCFKKKYIKLTDLTLFKSFRVGFPTAIRFIGLFVFNVVNILLISHLGQKLGTPVNDPDGQAIFNGNGALYWQSIYAAVYPIYALFTFGAFGVGQAINNIASFNAPNNNWKRIAQILRSGFLAQIGYFVICNILIIPLGWFLTYLYLGNNEGAVFHSYAYFALLVSFGLFFLPSIQYASTSLYQAINKVRFAALIASLRFFLIYIPVAICFGFFISSTAHNPLWILAFFASQTITDLIATIIIWPTIKYDHKLLSKNQTPLPDLFRKNYIHRKKIG